MINYPAEDNNYLALETSKSFKSIHNAFMSSDDQVEIIFMKKCLYSIRTKFNNIACACWIPDDVRLYPKFYAIYIDRLFLIYRNLNLLDLTIGYQQQVTILVCSLHGLLPKVLKAFQFLQYNSIENLLIKINKDSTNSSMKANYFILNLRC